MQVSEGESLKEQFEVLARVYEKLDLKGSAVSGTKRNDLLPGRVDDNIGGHISDRLLASVLLDLKTSSYEPHLAHLVPVPKPKYATRPAALLSVIDRVVYAALVDVFRPRLDKRMISKQVVFWPRATEDNAKAWQEFENAPVSVPGSHIVRADIAGFYESIDHRILQRRLTELTGIAEVADALVIFLGRVMDSDRGLPQGLSASDVLATCYLSPVDEMLLRSGVNYWRHGDDVRMTVSGHDAGRRAVYLFEQELRKLKLLLNSDKTRVMKRSTYEKSMTELKDEQERVKEDLIERKQEGVFESDLEDLEDLFEKAGIDEDIQFAIFYHETMSIEEIAEELRPHLEPSQVELARAIYDGAISKAPNATGKDEKLSPDIFHATLANSLTRMIAADDDYAVRDCASLILDFPDETETVCSYLRSLASVSPEEVEKEVTTVFQAEFLMGWQEAWLISALQAVVNSGSSLTVETWSTINSIAENEEAEWISRTAAARLMGHGGELNFPLFNRLWSRVPPSLRSELVDAVFTFSEKNKQQTWANAFASTFESDPVYRVVVQNAKNSPTLGKTGKNDQES